MGLLSIDRLSLDDVCEAVRTALATPAPPRAKAQAFDDDMIADFVASVDWGHYEEARPEVRDALGALESWSTDFSEDVMSEAAYEQNLRSMVATEQLRASG